MIEKLFFCKGVFTDVHFLYIYIYIQRRVGRYTNNMKFIERIDVYQFSYTLIGVLYSIPSTQSFVKEDMWPHCENPITG